MGSRVPLVQIKDRVFKSDPKSFRLSLSITSTCLFSGSIGKYYSFPNDGASRYHRWIPAFAGMTEVQCLTRKPLSDNYVITLLSFPRMRESTGRNSHTLAHITCQQNHLVSNYKFSIRRTLFFSYQPSFSMPAW
jgi:hypothetical protein